MAKTLQAARLAAIAAISTVAIWGSNAVAADAAAKPAAQPVMLPTMVITAHAIPRLETALVTAPAIQRLSVAVVTAPAPATQIARAELATRRF